MTTIGGWEVVVVVVWVYWPPVRSDYLGHFLFFFFIDS